MLWPLVAAVALAVGVTVVLLVWEDPLRPLGRWGYPGIFLVMLINNLTILLPALGMAILAAAAQTLNPWLLGFVGASARGSANCQGTSWAIRAGA